MQSVNSMNIVTPVWSTPNAEKLIVEMARVSAPKNQKNKDTGPRLLRYLIRHKHWSPFEMASMCLEINTTRSISPQILRHRSFSFQEFSQRYANTGEIGKPSVPHLRSQDYNNRQNSIDNLQERLGKIKLSDYYRRISILFEDAEHLYQEMVSDGIAKECARSILPLACPTRMYMTGTLRSWLHYIELRTDKGTQLEHREIAEECKAIFTRQFPIISEAMWPQEQELASN
jgi:thymidylate synthase (FAD)